jgi:hypothetical protein
MTTARAACAGLTTTRVAGAEPTAARVIGPLFTAAATHTTPDAAMTDASARMLPVAAAPNSVAVGNAAVAAAIDDDTAVHSPIHPRRSPLSGNSRPMRAIASGQQRVDLGATRVLRECRTPFARYIRKSAARKAGPLTGRR